MNTAIAAHRLAIDNDFIISHNVMQPVAGPTAAMLTRFQYIIVYVQEGAIEQYWCNQDPLHVALFNINSKSPKLGAPHAPA